MKDEILLKIHRQFSKEESMKYLFEFIDQLKIEKGILQSERDESNFELINKKQEIINLKKQIIGEQKRYSKSESRQIELELLAKIKSQRKVIKRLLTNTQNNLQK